jgi:hypothetical protein
MKSFISIWTAVKYKFSCLSIFTLLSISSFACGPSFEGFYFTWLMEAYQPNSTFYDYQFDAYSPLYGKSWYQDNENIFNPRQENINAWRKNLNLNNSVHDSVIEKYIYNNNLEALRTFKKNKYSKNEIEKAILKNEFSHDLISYFIYINNFSENYKPKNDVWNYETYTSFTSLDSVKNFINEGEILLNKTTSDFLQTRILYTQMRASQFNKYDALTIKTFEDNYTKLKNKNTLEKYWCEGLYAGALLKINEQEKAIYHFARAFAHCPDLSSQYMTSYSWTNRNWKGALAYCQSTQDSIYVILMAGTKEPFPTMDFIKHTYKSNPNSETLKLLWLREANKIDEFKFSNNQMMYSYKTDEYINIDSVYKKNDVLTEYEMLGMQILNSPNNIQAKASIGNSMSYYFYKLKNYTKAAECISKNENTSKDEIEKLQFDLLKNLNNLKITNKFNEENFEKLVLQFSKIPNGSMNKNIGYYLIYNEIAPYYLNQNNNVTAFWAYTYANCFNNDKFYLYSTDNSPESWNSVNMATYLLNHKFDVSKIDELKNAFKKRKGNSDFETFLIKGTKMEDANALFNLVIARKYMMAQNWQAALDLYPQLDSNFKNTLGPNPANFYIHDYFNDIQDSKKTFSTISILQLAKTLKEKADQKNIENAKDKMLYGTLLYNLSFYGKNHYVIDNHWNHYGSRRTPYFLFETVTANYFYNEEQKDDLPMNNLYQNYFYLVDAEKYLQAALPMLKNQEEKAQCVFLLAKCWQKRCPIDEIKDDNFYSDNFNIYYKHSLKNPYFKTLLEDFKNTKNQELYFKSCSYFTDYVKRN